MRFVQGPHSGPNRHARRSAKYHKAIEPLVVESKSPVEVKGRAVKPGLVHRAKTLLRSWFGRGGK